jgi:hypothetical protein
VYAIQTVSLNLRIAAIVGDDRRADQLFEASWKTVDLRNSLPREKRNKICLALLKDVSLKPGSDGGVFSHLSIKKSAWIPF